MSSNADPNQIKRKKTRNENEKALVYLCDRVADHHIQASGASADVTTCERLSIWDVCFCDRRIEMALGGCINGKKPKQKPKQRPKLIDR